VEPLDPSSTGLGIPLAEYVENYIVAPMTDGLHNILRSTVQHLSRQNTHPLPKPIASQIDLSLNTHPSIWHNLTQLKQITSEAIDMAALIRFPAELFLSENEWAGARWKEEREKEAEEEKARAMGFSQPDGQSANEYLAFAIKSHQEVQAQGTVNGSGGYGGDVPEMLQFALDHAADAIVDMDSCRRDGTLELKLETEDEGNEEDARLRALRLNLLALAKRAPLDKIQRLPAELVPEHIRHFVPTVATSLSL